MDEKWGLSTKEVQSLIPQNALFKLRIQQYAQASRSCPKKASSDYNLGSKMLTDYDMDTDSGMKAFHKVNEMKCDI